MKRLAIPALAVAVAALAGNCSVALAGLSEGDKHDPPDKIDRLVGLARVWAEAKFFHPAMFTRTIDWDGALIKAIPEVEAAADAKAYSAAVGRMLAAIGDPRTIASVATNENTPAVERRSWAAKDVLVLDARPPSDPFDYKATARYVREIHADLVAAKVVVIDLRGLSGGDNGILDWLLDDLPSAEAWPTIKSIQHDGFRSQGETNRNTYVTSWVITSSGAPTPGASAGPRHVVFVADPRNTLPQEAVALWASGHATLVSTGALDDSAGAQTKSIEVPYGVVVHVRVADVILPGGRAIASDVVVGTGDVRARAIAVASVIAAGGSPPRAPERRATASYELHLADDDDSPRTGVPSRERRLLAGFRAWAVIEYFHGVRRLNHDWEHQLRTALPRLEAATDFDTYRDVLAEMLVAIDDGHTGVSVPSERATRAATAIYWRRIEGRIVAGGFRDEAQAKGAGIALGDELISVNGVPVEEAFASKLRITPGGTDEARRQWTAAIVDRGPRGTTVDDEVRGADGKVRRVTLKREFGHDNNFYARSGPHFRVMAGNIGYADLARLTSDEIDAMFDALGKTRAIVFDMRGYPNGTGWLIGERVNTRNASALAEIRSPVVTAHSSGDEITTRVLQRGRPTTKPLYRGKIVVLIDDRAASAGEHTCLVLEATGGARFVGSPTNGTNGEETYARLPGGLDMRFTGMEILHADGRQLQKIGIQPDITVRPTLRSLRAGKDEVLDRAIRYLQTGK